MATRRILELGGIAAGVLMIAFGIGSLVLGINARNTVRDELTREFIVGSPDMNPAETEKAVEEAGLSNVPIPSCDVAEKEIKTGDRRPLLRPVHAHPRARVVGRQHLRADGTLRRRGGPDDPKGTSDEAAAAKDESGKPISNGARNTWVTETALATALNVSYMAEQIGLFSVVVGIALLLSGIGFIILALAVLGGHDRRPTTS